MEDLLEKIEWPSTRVPQGGMFHIPKVQYSKDTQELMKILMEEAHLTMMQRKKLNYHLRNGDPLPQSNQRESNLVSDDENMQAYRIMMRVRNSRRRSLEVIKASGVYEKDKFVATRHLRESSEQAKLRLQQVMSGIKEFPGTNHLKVGARYKHKTKNREFYDPIKECEWQCIELYQNYSKLFLYCLVVSEIYERADWLAEMEDLGEGKQHRDIIQAQIAERLREIKRIEKEKKHIAELESQHEKLKRIAC